MIAVGNMLAGRNATEPGVQFVEDGTCPNYAPRSAVSLSGTAAPCSNGPRLPLRATVRSVRKCAEVPRARTNARTIAVPRVCWRVNENREQQQQVCGVGGKAEGRRWQGAGRQAVV